MILSFHPLIPADKNILCAGRNPDKQDFEAIKCAHVVILPQGCKKKLYEMARYSCRHVFPNYDMRFCFPGKLAQIELFQIMGISHPKTICFDNLKAFFSRYKISEKDLPLAFPFVFKFDWGGEGDMVFLIRSLSDLSFVITRARRYEISGQKGFLIQEYIPLDAKSLRTVVIGNNLYSYWRIQKDPNTFKTGLASGSSIDYLSDPQLRQTAERFVKPFLQKTKINLAGIDIIFSSLSKKPYILEINYFFGRRGLGGSEAFYKILIREINQWLASLGYRRCLEIDTP